MKRIIIAAASLVLLASCAELPPEKCEHFRVDGRTQHTFGCIQKAGPDIVAAVRKRYPDLEGDIQLFDDGDDRGADRYHLAFFIEDGSHISCRVKRLKPIKLGRCGMVHA
jgi:hypothetical protein